MPDYNREDLKQLLTAAELKLVQSSQQPALSNLSEAKLKKQIDLTRKARDKWRDQATRQRREVQRAQGSRVTDAAARSADKNKILTKALNALQKQLDKIEAGTAEPGTKTPTQKAPGKKKRVKQHRESRAEVRASLEEKRAKLAMESTPKKKAAQKGTASKGTVTKKKSAQNKAIKKKAVKKTPTKKVAAKKAAPKKKVSAKKIAAAAATSSKPTAAKKKTAKKNSPASTQLASGQAERLNLNPNDQRTAKTKAKAARIQKSGVTTRRQAHTSARGKRSQGRRDSRG